MGHDDVYLFNNRIKKMKDVDKYIKKIGTWRENEKEIIIGVLAFLLSCTVFYAGIRKFQKDNMYLTIEVKKTQKTKPANNTMYFYLEKQGIQR